MSAGKMGKCSCCCGVPPVMAAVDFWWRVSGHSNLHPQYNPVEPFLGIYRTKTWTQSWGSGLTATMIVTWSARWPGRYERIYLETSCDGVVYERNIDPLDGSYDDTINEDLFDENGDYIGDSVCLAETVALWEANGPPTSFPGGIFNTTETHPDDHTQVLEYRDLSETLWATQTLVWSDYFDVDDAYTLMSAILDGFLPGETPPTIPLGATTTEASVTFGPIDIADVCWVLVRNADQSATTSTANQGVTVDSEPGLWIEDMLPIGGTYRSGDPGSPEAFLNAMHYALTANPHLGVDATPIFGDATPLDRLGTALAGFVIVNTTSSLQSVVDFYMRKSWFRGEATIGPVSFHPMEWVTYECQGGGGSFLSALATCAQPLIDEFGVCSGSVGPIAWPESECHDEEISVPSGGYTLEPLSTMGLLFEKCFHDPCPAC